MDLSQLSDKDLQALSKGNFKGLSDEGLQHVSQMTAPATKEEKSAAFQSGVADAGTLGNASKIRGLIQTLVPNPSAAVDAKLKAQGVKISEPDFNDYDTQRAQFQADIDRQKQVAPEAYAGGQLATGAALAAAPLTKGAQLGVSGARGLLALADRYPTLKKAALLAVGTHQLKGLLGGGGGGGDRD